MVLYPAIDLRGGKCVRLTLGDFDRETVYGGDPVAVAASFIDQGAEWIHVVDLDGARAGVPVQLPVIREIAALGVPVQLGGGIRDETSLKAALGSGVARVVIGSALTKDPAFAERAFSHFGDRIAAGIDARDGVVAISGWEESSGIGAVALAQQLESRGCARIVFTDIGRDGTLIGPNLESLLQMIASVSIPVIASGGISTIEDLRALTVMQPGSEGVIVGKALYEGRFSVSEALAALK